MKHIQLGSYYLEFGRKKGPKKNKAKRVRKRLVTSIGKLVEKISFGTIAFIIIGLTTISTVYFMYAPIMHCTNQGQLTFSDALYFSVITFTSLGYGDIAPCGFGRMVAALEVLSGIILIAFFVGKLASERQSALLMLVYSSEQQQRITEFAKNINDKNISIQNNIETTELEKLQLLSDETYGFVSSICSYLILHAFQGDIASFGNTSSLRKLYKSFNQIQKSAFKAMQIYGLSEKASNEFGNIIGKLSSTARRMKTFHSDDPTALGILDEIAQNGQNLLKWNEDVTTGKVVLRSETEMTNELIGKIKFILEGRVWEKGIYKKIASELSISNKLADKCIHALVERGDFSIPPTQNDKGSIL